MSNDVERLLDILADYQAQERLFELNKADIIDGILQEKQNKIDEILTPEIRQAIARLDTYYDNRLSDVEAEYAGRLEAVKKSIANLQSKIKEKVVALGQSVKGKYLHAVYAKPRVTWDTKALDGYAVAHPELMTFRKVGEPSVSFRDAKN